MEQVTYSSFPFLSSNRHNAQRICNCCCPNPLISPGRRSHFISGWRRTTPEAEQGTSAKIRWNGLPSHQLSGCAASPFCNCACNCRRCKFSRTRSKRCALLSKASRSNCASSSRWVLFPPGAAHASSTRIPSCTSNKRAAYCAPASCTDTKPSQNPGNLFTGRGVCNSTASGPIKRA